MPSRGGTGSGRTRAIVCRRPLTALWAVPTIWLPMASLVAALVLVALGLLPDQERALYLTAVAIGLYMGAVGLFSAVFLRHHAPIGRAGMASSEVAGGGRHAGR